MGVETFHVLTSLLLVVKHPKPISKPTSINQRFDLHVTDKQNGLPHTSNSLNVISSWRSRPYISSSYL